MKYVILILIMALIIFAFIYPFKIIINNKSNYLYVNISNLLVFKLNLLGIIDKARNEGLKKNKAGSDVIKNIKFKKIGLRLSGINFNYRLNGYYYGLLCSLFGFLKAYLDHQNIEFNYNLNYLGEENVDFEGIVRARAYKVISAISKI